MSPYLFILCSEFLTLAFKESPNIEGISIYDKEHSLSQYADDTSAFLKATEQNLRNSLDILEWFYHVSGLKINLTKTKVIRIGPIRETDHRFCRENNLDWVSSFTALGIEYDTLNMHQISDFNIRQKIESMKKLMQLWTCRNITPIGRVTIFKSLILSKIIHVLQSLPTPSKELLSEIEKMSTTFIWKGKRHKVNKKVLCSTIEKGGLNMINLSEFDYSLKIGWIHKTIFTYPEWIEFALKSKIDRLPWTGTSYHTLLINSAVNPFWQCVIKAYKEWYLVAKNSLILDPKFEPIWGNNSMKIPFNADLYRNNFLLLQDLFNENSELLSKLDLERRIGKPLMFTVYFAIQKAIPNEWKCHLKENLKDTNMTMPPMLNFLKKCAKGTSQIRLFWSQRTEVLVPIGQQKWIIELGLNDNEDWSYLYTIARTCKLNANIVYLQFQILHRSIITNKKNYSNLT